MLRSRLFTCQMIISRAPTILPRWLSTFPLPVFHLPPSCRQRRRLLPVGRRYAFTKRPSTTASREILPVPIPRWKPEVEFRRQGDPKRKPKTVLAAIISHVTRCVIRRYLVIFFIKLLREVIS